MSAAVDYGYPLHHSPPAFQYPTDNPLPVYDGHASTMGDQRLSQQSFNLGFLATNVPQEHKRFSSASTTTTQQRHFSIPLIQQPPSPQFAPPQAFHYYQTPRQSIDSLHVPSARKSRTFSTGSMGAVQQQQTDRRSKRASRRSDSTSTTGTSASSVALQRSGSDSSTHSVSPYVLTLRKQKATVWCDRSQNEDARLKAAMRADKQRADREVARSSGMSPVLHGANIATHKGKIRHHNNQRKSEYNPNLSLVAGIPARLDIGEESGDENDVPLSPGAYSQKAGSQRSSINSGRKRYLSGQFSMQISTNSPSPHGGSTSNTNASSPSSYSRASSFTAPAPPQQQPSPPPPPPPIKETVVVLPPPIPPKAPRSPRSPKMELPAMNFSQPRPKAVTGASYDSTSSKKSHLNGVKASEGLHKSDSFKKREDIRRRGSVDEMKARTRTMTGVRLFVANPDQ